MSATQATRGTRPRKSNTPSLTAPVVTFPRCSLEETYILQLRGRGMSFREIERRTGIGPRKASDLYFAAMTKIVAYLEQDAFLRSSS